MPLLFPFLLTWVPSQSVLNLDLPYSKLCPLSPQDTTRITLGLLACLLVYLPTRL